MERLIGCFAALLLLLLFATCRGSTLPTARFTSIQSTAASQYIALNTTIHDGAQRFDLDLLVHHLEPSHRLLLGLKLKLRPTGSSHFVTVYKQPRLRLCRLLSHAERGDVLQRFIALGLPKSFAIRCPIKPGRYELHDFGVNNTLMRELAVTGTFRMFVDIVQVDKEVLKLLSLQITTQFDMPGKKVSAAAGT